MTTAAAVDPERLLKELRGLWRDLGKEDPGGVLRACAMTLIVIVEETHDADAISHTITLLMPQYPGRLIMVRVRDCVEQVLEARVFAQCWKPFGRQQQICCEQIEIITSQHSLADAASVIRGLTVPDLPSIAFCPGEQIWSLPQFSAILPLATKLVLDSCGMDESARVFDFWRSMPPHPDQRADLVWSRLTAWRQAVARIFENPTHANNARSLRTVTISYSAPQQPSAAFYLGGWFRYVLRGRVAVEILPQAGLDYAGIVSVQLAGDQFQATIALTEKNTAETRINGSVLEVTAFPLANEEYAMRQELSIAGGDPLFERVLVHAQDMKEQEA